MSISMYAYIHRYRLMHTCILTYTHSLKINICCSANQNYLHHDPVHTVFHNVTY